VAENLFHRLGNRGQVYAWTLWSGIFEEILLGEDGLPHSGQTGDENYSIGREATIEDLIESRIPAR
jgi:hypothetical protein